MKKEKFMAALMACFLAFTVTGCDKADKQCKEIGEQFMTALIEHDDDMVDYCKDDDEAESILLAYDDNDVIDLIMANASYELSEADCSTKSGTGTVIYTLTIPDVEEAYEQVPDDIDELEEMIPDLPTDEITVKLKYKLRGDNWYITNFDSVMEDTYSYIDGFDFCFIDYDSVIASQSWFNAISEDEYSGFTSFLEYDLIFTEGLDMDFTVTFSYEGDEIYSNVYNGSSDSVIAFLSAYDLDCDRLPAGQYALVITDSRDRVVVSETVTVNEVSYDDYFDYDNWYGRLDDPNIYSSNTSYVDYDIYFTDYLYVSTNCEWYYNGTLVKEEVGSIGTYAYYYLYDEDMVSAGIIQTEGAMPAGEYEVVIYDDNGVFIASSVCIVEEFEGVAVVESTNWYNRDDDPNIYDADTSYIDFDVYFEDYYGGVCTFAYYYEGEEIYSGSYYSGDYCYCYCYQADIGISDGSSFPTGEYTVTVWDVNGDEIATDSCIIR